MSMFRVYYQRESKGVDKRMTYWTEREPIKEDSEKRLSFIKAGLEELDSSIKVKIRKIKPRRGGKYW